MQAFFKINLSDSDPPTILLRHSRCGGVLVTKMNNGRRPLLYCTECNEKEYFNRGTKSIHVETKNGREYKQTEEIGEELASVV